MINHLMLAIFSIQLFGSGLSGLCFTKDNYNELLIQIESKALYADATFHSEDKFGKRYTVDLLIEGAKGQQATVRTGWLVSLEEDKAHLVTIYIKKR